MNTDLLDSTVKKLDFSNLTIKSVFDRMLSLATKPKEAWNVIKEENTPSSELINKLYSKLLILTLGLLSLPLMLISPLFTIIISIAFYFIILKILAIQAKIVCFLVKKLGAETTREDAIRLLIYGALPIMLISPLQSIPIVGTLVGFLSLYFIYVFYLGIEPILMLESKKIIFIILNTIIQWALLFLVIVGLMFLIALLGIIF